MCVYIHIYAYILTFSCLIFYVLTSRGPEDKSMVLYILDCATFLNRALVVQPVFPTLSSSLFVLERVSEVGQQRHLPRLALCH